MDNLDFGRCWIAALFGWCDTNAQAEKTRVYPLDGGRMAADFGICFLDWLGFIWSHDGHRIFGSVGNDDSLFIQQKTTPTCMMHVRETHRSKP